MSSSIFSVFLPVALALIMFGLGLTLTVADFARVVKIPKAALVALGCQILLLPAIALGLVLIFGLRAELAVGMMLLAASPGGTTANLFSHIAGGDVALNITLTAVNSVLALVTLPIVVGLSISEFMGTDSAVGIQPGKMIQVFAIVLIPVLIGMWVHRRFTRWAERMRGPVKIASIVGLVLIIVIAVFQEYQILLDHWASIGVAALLLSIGSLIVGYAVPRLFGVSDRQSISSAFEIGIHNTTLSIAVAVSALGSTVIAVPSAIYGVLMFFPATAAAYLLARRNRPVAATA